jgi:hypothetical protein
MRKSEGGVHVEGGKSCKMKEKGVTNGLEEKGIRNSGEEEEGRRKKEW